MTPKTSRVMVEEEETRGGGGCFGWLCKLFRGKKGGRRPKNKEIEPSLTCVDSEEGHEEVCSAAAAAEEVGEERQKDKELTWAEEVDEAEENGLDVFAPEISVLPHTAFVYSATSASPENEATGAAATERSMTACQRRRARRRALRAARKASAEDESATKRESHASPENEAVSDRPTEDSSEAAHRGTTATRRRRARRKAAAPTNQSVWPSPSVRVYGSDGLPFVTTWEEAAYGAFHAQRHR